MNINKSDLKWMSKKKEEKDENEEDKLLLSEIFKVPESIDSLDNHIYFYSEVDRDSILKLNKKILQLETHLNIISKKYGISPIPIYLHINSYGGYVHAAMAAVDQIINCSVPIITIVEGCAASAATLISVVGNHRIITPHSCMLIHELSSMFWGKFHEFIDEMKNLEMLMLMIKSIYEEKTSIPKVKLNSILKKDLWFEPKICLKYSLVDEIGRGAEKY